MIVPVNAALSAWAKQQLNPRIHVTKKFFDISFLLNARLNHANLKTTLKRRPVIEYSTDIVETLSARRCGAESAVFRLTRLSWSFRHRPSLSRANSRIRRGLRPAPHYADAEFIEARRFGLSSASVPNQSSTTQTVLE